MNIKLPYSWIRDYLKTETPPETVFKLVTASGPTIERIEKIKDDYLLDIEVTINRPDCLSVLGIAREMYAVLKQNNHKANLSEDCLTLPPRIIEGKEKVPFQFLIDPELCPRFMAVKMDVKIGPSPEFIVKRLEKAGLRSLNNVVDITNFLMLETGQPNHAFDFNKIKGPKFLIRAAKKGEKVTTLDGQKRLLETGDIIYEDEEKIFDLAGIMGGKASEIDESTTNIFFTVVNLYYAQIRQTSMRLGIQTEASARLTKVLNPSVLKPVLLRGVELFQKYASAKIVSKIYDFYPVTQKTIAVKATNEELDRLLGITIPEKTKINILETLGFTVKKNNRLLSVVAPSWRLNDISLPEDLTEEIARIFNYDQIKNQAPIFELPTFSPSAKRPFLTGNRLRHLLVDWGFNETLSFSMLGQKDLEITKLPLKKALKITNPLSEEWVYLQPTLIPNLLKNLSLNQYQKPEIKVFEIANIFNEKQKETETLGLAILNSDFYDLKGTIEQLFNFLGLKNYLFEKSEDFRFDNQMSARFLIKDVCLGSIGLVKEEITKAYGLKTKPVVAEINLQELIKMSPPVRQYRAQGKYNPIVEDLSVNLPSGITYKQIEDLIAGVSGVEKIEYLDRFEKHLTLRVYYQLKNQQISKNESLVIREEILNSLKKKLKVELH